jgi:predicted ATP-grasp superfamily ATP-dependent carboligase
MSPDSNFEVDVSPDIEPGQTLLVGLSSVGLAGLTAVDYLVRHSDAEEIGHVSPDELPAITPIEDVYDISIDLSELEDLSDTIKEHYASLAERMEKLRETEDSRASQEYAEDRMFM